MTNETVALVELSNEQQTTIEQTFKVEHLKDELALNKMFDYDFNLMIKESKMIKSIVKYKGTNEPIQFRLKRVEIKMLYSDVQKRFIVCVFHDYNHYYTHYKII